jgi:hypothetical protein
MKKCRKISSPFFVRVGDSGMLLSNADLTDSLRENADKNRLFYCIFCHADQSGYVMLCEVAMSG